MPPPAAKGDMTIKLYNTLTRRKEAFRPIDPNNVRSRWKSALKRASLPANVRLYDTRHSHATALLNDGNVNLAWVSARLGHTSVQTTEAVYARVLPEAHRQMADTMEQILQRAKQRKTAHA